MPNDADADNKKVPVETKVAPPQNAINRVNSIGQAGQAGQLEQPGFIYIPPEMLIQLQMAEAESHQQIVDSGRIWQHYPLPGQTPLPTTTLACPAIKIHDPDLEWTNEHKSVFIELIGRWSPSALPEIAQVIKKPLFECQRYLEMLRNHPRCIDTAEIPAADEVPPEYCEPDIIMPRQPSNEHEETKSDLFVRFRMEKKFNQKFSNHKLNQLEALLVEKLKNWLAEFTNLYASAGHLCRDQKEFIDKIVMGKSEIRYPEWLQAENNEDVEDADSELLEKGSRAFEVEANLDDLVDQETNWLESLDYYNSTIGMQSRGIPLLPVPPPPNRTAELQSFMFSRD